MVKKNEEIEKLEAEKLHYVGMLERSGKKILKLQNQTAHVQEHEADTLRDTQKIAELGSAIDDLRVKEYEHQLRMKEFESDRLHDAETIATAAEQHEKLVKMYDDSLRHIARLEAQKLDDQQMLIDSEGVVEHRGTINGLHRRDRERQLRMEELENDKINDSETIIKACEANEKLNDLYEDYQRYIAQLEAEKLSDAQIVKEHRERHERDMEHQTTLARKFEEWRKEHDNELASVHKLKRDKEIAEKHRTLQARYEKMVHELEEHKRKQDPTKRRGSRG